VNVITYRDQQNKLATNKPATMVLSVQSTVEQTVLWTQLKIQALAMARKDALYVLPALSAASVSWILVDAAVAKWRSRLQSSREKGTQNGNGDLSDSLLLDQEDEADLKALSSQDEENSIFLDGGAIAAYRFTRFLSALALLAIQLHQSVVYGWSWAQVGLLVFYVCPYSTNLTIQRAETQDAALRIHAGAVHSYHIRPVPRCRFTTVDAAIALSVHRLFLPGRLALRNKLSIAI
jgi:hypothetical protein